MKTCPQCGMLASRLYLIPDQGHRLAGICARCRRFHNGKVSCKEFRRWVAEIRADAAGQALRSAARRRA